MDLQEGYDRIAKNYERGRLDYRKESIGLFAKALGLKKGKKILDLAAGTGKLTKAIKALPIDLIAVEPSSEMRAIFAEQHPQVPILEGKAEEIPLASQSVDVVLVGTAFHWFDNPKALLEIGRVLRKGGSFGLIWNLWDGQVGWVRAVRSLLHRYEPQEHRNKSKWLHEASDIFAEHVRGSIADSALFSTPSHTVQRYVVRGTKEDVFAMVKTLKVSESFSKLTIEDIQEELNRVLESDPSIAGKEEFDMPYRVEMFCCQRI